MMPVAEADSIQGVLEPTGFRLLVRIPNLPAQMKKHENLIMTDETRALEESAQLSAQVVAMGPDAYTDKERFPSGPWCKVGDYVVIRMYVGTRFKINGSIYGLINDDTVQGVVRGDPTEIERPQ
jgi:co-chaperonin GroES (HSP10)